MSLGTAMRLLPRNGQRPTAAATSPLAIAFVGSGGKTTAIQALAEELPGPTVVTTTTHVGSWQIEGLGRHIVAEVPGDLSGLGNERVTIVTGPPGADERLPAPSIQVLAALRNSCLTNNWPLLVEADGARQKPLKAAAQHEPQIPPFVEVVVVVAGMEAIGKRLGDATVHRAEIFSREAGISVGDIVNPQALGRYMVSATGGTKGIPAQARRVAVLNQADSLDRQAAARSIARRMLSAYDAVLISTAASKIVHASVEPVAGIVLAAGGSTRFGSVKQLLNWNGEPLVRSAARVAFESGLHPVVVVTGAHAESVEAAVSGLQVKVARNAAWATGQASSIRCGLDACPPETCAATFLLADQPFVSTQVLLALLEEYGSEAAAIVAPLVEGDRRANPVLFDRETFHRLRRLSGDQGGRSIFADFRVRFLPWHEERIARDIDTPEDYRRLMEEGSP